MKEYHKIQSLFKRDKSKKMIFTEYSIPEFKYLENCEWDFTEKVNGTNICIKWDGKNVRFGNPDSQIPVSLIDYCMDNVFNKIDTFQRLFKDKNVEIYGEGYGKGIQETDGSRYFSKGADIIIFDVNVDGWWLDKNSCIDIAAEFALNMVPCIGSGTLFDMLEIVRRGFISCLSSRVIAEGIVAKPKVDLNTRSGDRIITKLKYLDFPEKERGNGETICKPSNSLILRGREI